VLAVGILNRVRPSRIVNVSPDRWLLTKVFAKSSESARRCPAALSLLADHFSRNTLARQPAGQRNSHGFWFELFTMLDHLIHLLSLALNVRVTGTEPLQVHSRD
jgi:hypothetical protein